jgi:hypothetical protein
MVIYLVKNIEELTGLVKEYLYPLSRVITGRDDRRHEARIGVTGRGLPYADGHTPS